MKATKKRFGFNKQFIVILLFLTVVILLGFGGATILASTESAETSTGETWRFYSVLFMILDVVEIFIILILASILRKLNKKRKLLSNLNCFTGISFTIMAITIDSMNFTIITAAIFLFLFLVICDLSYCISQAKSLPIEKKESDIKRPEIYNYTDEEKKEIILSKTVEEWYQEEVAICFQLAEETDGTKPIINYLEDEITKESAFVGTGEGYPNRVIALNMLLNEYSNSINEQESLEVTEAIEEAVKTTEEWYEEEKNIINSFSLDISPFEYIEAEANRERKLLSSEKGNQNRLNALQQLYYEYYSVPKKTVEEWYQVEKNNCLDLLVKSDNENQPFEYLNDEIEKGSIYKNRIATLKILLERYTSLVQKAKDEKPIKTVEQWYKEEKKVIDRFDKKDEQTHYIKKTIASETHLISNGKGYKNRLKALEMLLDEYYFEPVKTVGQWYQEEKENTLKLKDDKGSIQPLEYLDEQIISEGALITEGVGYVNRLEALKMLRSELGKLFKKDNEDEILLKSVEEWYEEEKIVALDLEANSKNPKIYIEKEIEIEKKKVASGNGFSNRVTALEQLEDVYKTVDDWYYEELYVCGCIASRDEHPIHYVDTQLFHEVKKVDNKEGFPNRVTALQRLHEEYYIEEDEELFEDIFEEDIEEVIEEEIPEEVIEEVIEENIPEEVIDEDLEEEITKLSLEEEAALREKEILEARQAYVESKKKGDEVIVPVMAFLLSREDILDYIEKMVGPKYPVTPTIRRRKRKYTADGLKCGVWTFGLMYEKNGVIKIIARMEDEFVEKISEVHTGITKATFPKNGNWYDIIFDSSYASKEEVYEIIEYLYNYILNKYYTYDKLTKTYITDEEAAVMETEDITSEADEIAKESDETLEQAIKEYELSLQQYREKYKVPFKTSRDKIQRYVKRVHSDSELITREKAYRPTTLKLASNNKAYVLFYEKDDNVWMIIRCYDKYAKMLQRYHPLTTRARFPRPHNWYVVHVDGTYKTSSAIYKVIKNAKKYAMDGCPKEIEKTKKRKKKEPAKKVAKKTKKKSKTKKTTKKGSKS